MYRTDRYKVNNRILIIRMNQFGEAKLSSELWVATQGISNDIGHSIVQNVWRNVSSLDKFIGLEFMKKKYESRDKTLGFYSIKCFLFPKSVQDLKVVSFYRKRPRRERFESDIAQSTRSIADDHISRNRAVLSFSFTILLMAFRY